MVTESTIVSRLQSLEHSYQPNEAVLAQLATKQLVLLVSPAAVGKSTLMNRVVELDERFGRISGLTTRPAREEDEPGMYRYIPHGATGLSGLLHQVTEGELVQYAIHPTTGHIYATELQDYPKQYNMKDVLGHAIAGFRVLPTAGSQTFGIVCEPSEWQERLTKRYPGNNSLDYLKRMQEARMNLEWSLQDSQTTWVANRTNRLDEAAQKIIEYSTEHRRPTNNEQSHLHTIAKDMLIQLP